MHIDWGTLVTIAVAAAAAALTVVLLMSFALVGWSAHSGWRVDGSDDGGVPGTRAAAGMAVAMLCVLAAGLIICYALYLILA